MASDSYFHPAGMNVKTYYNLALGSAPFGYLTRNIPDSYGYQNGPD
jgi:hypothetical protein